MGKKEQDGGGTRPNRKKVPECGSGPRLRTTKGLKEGQGIEMEVRLNKREKERDVVTQRNVGGKDGNLRLCMGSREPFSVGGWAIKSRDGS